MVCAFLQEDENIVQVREADAADEISKDTGYQSLIRRGLVALSERHLCHFVQADVRNERGLVDVRRLYWDLILRHREVEQAENCGACERIERLIESRERERVKLRDGVESADVDAHSPTSVFLPNNYYRRCPRRARGARDVCFNEFFDFLFDRGAHLTVGESAHRLTQRAHLAGVDLVKCEIGDTDIGIILLEDIEILRSQREQLRFVRG